MDWVRRLSQSSSDSVEEEEQEIATSAASQEEARRNLELDNRGEGGSVRWEGWDSKYIGKDQKRGGNRAGKAMKKENNDDIQGKNTGWE